MKKLFKEIGIEFLKSDAWMLIIIIGILTAVWQALELATVGEIQPSLADTIIGYAFGISILLNYRSYKADLKLRNLMLNKAIEREMIRNLGEPQIVRSKKPDETKK